MCGSFLDLDVCTGGSSSKINDPPRRSSRIRQGPDVILALVFHRANYTECGSSGDSLSLSACIIIHLKFPQKHSEINSPGAHKMSGILCDPVNLRIKVLQTLPAFVEKPQLAYHRQSQLSLCSTCPLSDPLSDAISCTLNMHSEW